MTNSGTLPKTYIDLIVAIEFKFDCINFSFYIPRFAIICGHPRFRSTPSQYGSTSWAAFRNVSGSFEQNCKVKVKGFLHLT